MSTLILEKSWVMVSLSIFQTLDHSLTWKKSWWKLKIITLLWFILEGRYTLWIDFRETLLHGNVLIHIRFFEGLILFTGYTLHILYVHLNSFKYIFIPKISGMPKKEIRARKMLPVFKNVSLASNLVRRSKLIRFQGKKK